MRDDIIKVVKEFFLTGYIEKHLKRTNIVLILKKKNSKTMADLRHITLFNVLYKSVSKVLANLLKRIIHQVVSKTQSAFIPGRSISDNVMIAYELMHYFK